MTDDMLSSFVVPLLLALALFVSLGNTAATAQFKSPGPQVYPGDYSYALNFQYGQPQTFQWITNATAVYLNLAQETTFVVNYVGTAVVYLDGYNDLGYYNWSGIPGPQQNLSLSNVFFLQLRDYAAAADAPPIATSNYFNITDIPASVLSTSTSTPTSTSSSSASTSTSTSAGASATPQSKSSNALPIGLGVGLGCAFLVALLAAGFFYRRYRKRRSISDPPGGSQDPQAGRESYWGAHSPYRYEEAAKYTGSSGPQPSFQHQSNSMQSSAPPHPQEIWGRNVQPLRPELQ